jgi:hypothetical protein
MPLNYDHDHDHEVTLFAETNFRNARRRFGIKTDDRRRHMYVLGKTGMGKTVLQENMVMSDVMAGHGVCYIDPHGDTAEKLLDMIPSNRINDVVYFNPADMEFPVGFNILETTNEEQKHLVASGLMGVFKKIWPDVWSPRMEYILLNCVLALLDYPGATLLGINRLLVDKEYRNRVIAKIRNPIVKTFWVAEFTSWSEKYATEAIAPVQNKVGQFLSASIIRNIVAQVKSTINPRQIMDEGKIFIVNLSKGKIGEDNMRLLGGMIVTKIQLAAMERVDIKNEDDRRDFYLFVDEFQNFANESFASVLSEARKYHLNLTVAHQYIEQLTEEVRDAVFGNVGTMIMFRVGAPDAQYLETEFTPTFTPEDLTNLAKYQIYLKLMVDGVATQPFSANTLPPIAKRTGSEAKVIAVSRERYAEPRAVIEEKVLRWSGMETSSMSAMPGTTLIPGLEYPAVMTEEERAVRESLGGVPASLRSSISAESAASGVAALEGAAAVEDTGEYLRISPERMAALAKPGAPPKKDKPKFKHTCTRCGKTWDMPIQLDPSRPMYCAECMPLMKEERKGKQKIMKQAVHSDEPGELGMRSSETAPANGSRGGSVLEAAMRDVEQGSPIRTPRRSEAHPTGTSSPRREPQAPANRPRLVVTDTNRLDRLTEDDEEDEDRSELLQDVERAKGRPMETRKQSVLPPKPMPTAVKPVEPQRSAPRQPDAVRDRPPHSRNDRRPRHDGPRPGGNSPRIVRDDPRPVPQNGPRPEKKAKPSLEEMFRDAEERTDREIERKPQTRAAEVERDEQDQHPTTVFRAPSPSDSSSGPRPIAPGQRVRFDE